jgi:hypothetical protein
VVIKFLQKKELWIKIQSKKNEFSKSEQKILLKEWYSTWMEKGNSKGIIMNSDGRNWCFIRYKNIDDEISHTGDHISRKAFWNDKQEIIHKNYD